MDTMNSSATTSTNPTNPTTAPSTAPEALRPQEFQASYRRFITRALASPAVTGVAGYRQHLLPTAYSPS